MQTLYDVEYARHFTGAQPIFLPATLLDASHFWRYRSWTGNRNDSYLVNGPFSKHHQIPKPLQLSKRFHFDVAPQPVDAKVIGWKVDSHGS